VERLLAVCIFAVEDFTVILLMPPVVVSCASKSLHRLLPTLGARLENMSGLDQNRDFRIGSVKGDVPFHIHIHVRHGDPFLLC
jgi:hypothetical protein